MGMSVLINNSSVSRIFRPQNVIQVGATILEDIGIFSRFKVKKALFIEGDPQNLIIAKKKLLEHPLPFQSEMIQAVLSDCPKEARFYRFGKHIGANSILPPKFDDARMCDLKYDFLEEPEPFTTTTTTLDLLLQGRKEIYDTLLLDCQGSEGAILRGAEKILRFINFAFVEVWKVGKTGYTNSENVEEIDRILKGFQRIHTYWPSDICTWGYAFYARPNIPHLRRRYSTLRRNN